MRDTDAYDVRIDRQTGWGNPFKIGPDGDRAEVIDKYHDYFWSAFADGKIILTDLAALHGKRLGCWCAPLPCHGDVLEVASEYAANLLKKGHS